MTRVIYRYTIPIDDHPHLIPHGTFVLVTPSRFTSDALEAWVLLDPADPYADARLLQVYGTGHPIPANAAPVGSCIAGSFVWHLMRLPEEGSTDE